MQMVCNKTNFPVKCFFNEDRNLVYVIYRQGQCITVNATNPMIFKFDVMTEERDLGQVELIYGKIVVASSSNKILFYKQE